MIVRLASDKYLKSGLAKTISEAVETIIEKDLKAHFQTHDSGNFRRQILWKEENDVVFSRVKAELRKVYDSYTGKLGGPGQKDRPMCLDEFQEMLGNAGLVDENFGQREIGPCYNLSQQTNRHEHVAQHHLDL